jgi:hypothetical protein
VQGYTCPYLEGLQAPSRKHSGILDGLRWYTLLATLRMKRSISSALINFTKEEVRDQYTERGVALRRNLGSRTNRFWKR